MFVNNGERVSIREGKLPVLIIAPHGYDGNDERTSIIAEYIATRFDTYMVINRGWEREDNVDYMLDKADCNNTNHCHEDVVREEFLDPIMRYKSRILRTYPNMHVFFIHGMSDRHKQISGDPNLDAVVGYGAGSPNSHTCDLWRKDLFIHLLNEAGLHVYEGSKGGPFSGWSRTNMNQLFRKWYPESRVQSMQIEIVHSLRNDEDMALITAEYLGLAIKDAITTKGFSTSRKIKSY